MHYNLQAKVFTIMSRCKQLLRLYNGSPATPCTFQCIRVGLDHEHYLMNVIVSTRLSPQKFNQRTYCDMFTVLNSEEEHRHMLAPIL